MHFGDEVSKVQVGVSMSSHSPASPRNLTAQQPRASQEKAIRMTWQGSETVRYFT